LSPHAFSNLPSLCNRDLPPTPGRQSFLVVVSAHCNGKDKRERFTATELYSR
jgi:hypothetical protein